MRLGFCPTVKIGRNKLILVEKEVEESVGRKKLSLECTGVSKRLSR